MKRISILATSMALLLMMSLTACNEKTNPTIGDAQSKLDGINDSFKLIKVIQVDERTAVLENKELDVTNIFLKGTPAEISFNSSDLTFSYDPGDAPNYLGGTDGSWKFVNTSYPELSDTYPEMIKLTSNGEEVDLVLLQTIRPVEATLEFKLVRNCDSMAAVGYSYIFERQ